MRIALLQDTTGEETTGEETTGFVDEAGAAARDATRDTVSVFESVNDFFNGAVRYLTSAEFFGNVLASAVVVALALFVYRVLTHGVPRVLRWRRRRQSLLDAEAVARIKRQDTAITLIRNALRYVVFVIVVLFVLSIFIRNPLPALGGATVVAAVIGFGAQSFLRDIIAGFSIIFEGQYSVGDFIQVKPQDVSGIVEELGLRMTKIRALSGEVHYVPNGTVFGVTNYVSGQQRFTVEVQLSDPEAVDRILGALDEASNLYLTPPRLVGREDKDGRVRLRIKAAAGEEALASSPLIYKVDQANLARIRSLIPEEPQKAPPEEG